MAEDRKGQALHVIISVVGMLCTAGGVWWTNTLTTERFMARIQQVITEQDRRIGQLEGRQVTTQDERVRMENRVTGLEAGQGTLINVMRELRDDVRALRGSAPRLQ